MFDLKIGLGRRAAALRWALAAAALQGCLLAQPEVTVQLPENDEFTNGAGRLIVRMRQGAPLPPQAAASSRSLGFGMHVVDVPPGLAVAEAARQLRQNPNVLYAEPDFEVSTFRTPNDTLWNQQWDMAKIAAPAGWDTQTDAPGVIVAVIDTGVDLTHPDLAANLWTNPNDGSHGFTCLNGTCVPGGQDDQGHGTHVAGTIGAVGNNGAGVAGVNWRVQILPCKFLNSSGSGNVSDAILCFERVLALKQQGFNIRVTNNSWGGGGYSQALKDAMEAVEAAGVVNVCAAGNSGVNADLAPMYPAAYNNRGIVSVLASDQNDYGAYFTNFGLGSVDLAAPGVSILSTVPAGSCSLCDASRYRIASGTSMAAPHVAGVLAAMFQRNPSLSPAQARDALLDPGSLDALTETRATTTSTGGRLNLQKALGNPVLNAPQLNGFPVLSSVPDVGANAGDTVNLTAAASDPDNDPLRVVWFNPSYTTASHWLMSWGLNQVFPAPSGPSVSFQAPALARTVTAPYAVAVADGKGGSASDVAQVTVYQSPYPGGAPEGTLTVTPTSGPVGTVVTITNNAVDPEGGPVAWDIWATSQGGTGICCRTSSHTLTMNAAGAYRISSQAIDRELRLSNRQSVVVRIGGATGTPPIASATYDKLTGPAPLTVNVNLSGSYDPDGSIQRYTTICNYATGGWAYTTSSVSCTYDTPGIYWMVSYVTDNDNLRDLISAYVVVTPAASAPPPAKTTATVTLSNLTQTYTGSPLTPTATTNPPGLPVVWTNAPQTNAGTYTVTATINHPSYEGSATGTFVINKAAATVALANLSVSYNGNPQSPSAATNPPGLAIAMTNAPQTNAGNYAVTASISDPNYQGSAGGTFTINKAAATVTLSNLTQTYTGSPLTPTATTNPPGLPIVWTNAPQTNIGTYAVTATVNHPNYQGSASGTFTIANANATVTLSNLTQTYTGSPLTPTATTNPPGLPIVWTNAPQTNAGTYTVTATINHPSYQGSATGTFVITKAAATVTLGNLTQIYTGSPLTPTATTNPPGLPVVWTNAPQTNAGTYNVTATINHPNYQGSASGTFTITAPAGGGGSTPPSVNITSPAPGGVPRGSQVTITANAVAGSSAIARVEFKVNGTVLCSDTAAPYTCAWNVPNAPNKRYDLQATAFDTAGRTGQSAVVSLTSVR
jgi:subtilisin family serine protease